jgi:two-component system OmpR family sensor kinase
LPLVAEIADGDVHDLRGDPEFEHYVVWRALDANGTLFLSSGNDVVKSWPAPPQASGFSSADDWRVYTLVGGEDGIVLQVAEDLAHRREAFYNTLIAMLSPLVLLLPLSVLAVWLVVRRAMRPVHWLGVELGKRGGGNLDLIEPGRLPLELQPLVGDVNRMMERLGHAIAAERAFAANSAHELRTPVAAAGAQAQLLAAELAGSSHGRRAGQLADALRKVGRLVEKLLQLARAEAGVGFSRDPVEIGGLAGFLIAEARRQYPAADLRMERGADALIVEGDGDMIGIVLQNLLDNAVRHGMAGKPILLRVGPGRELSISNAARVPAPEKLARLGERFARAESGADGSGLGLSIARSIMEQMGGRLEIHSPARGRKSGFEVVLRFA